MCLQNPLYVLTLSKLLHSLCPHTNKQAIGAVPAGSANETVPTVGISGPTPFLSAAADKEDHGQDRGIPVCYHEDAGLIPFRFKKGLEAIPSMPEYPCAPLLNPCSQLRSSISEGIQHQPHLPTPLGSSGCQTAYADRICLCCHLPRESSIPGFCSEERNRSTAGLPACTEAPGKPGHSTLPTSWGGKT